MGPGSLPVAQCQWHCGSSELGPDHHSISMIRSSLPVPMAAGGGLGTLRLHCIRRRVVILQY